MPNASKILLAKIEGLKITNDSFKTKSFFNSFQSIGTNNAFDFIYDFFKLLFGADKIKQELIRFLVYELKSLQEELKEFFKQKLIEYFSCSFDKVIPDKYFSEFQIPVKQIDYFGILKVDVDGEYSKYFYNQDDLNYFLYQRIKTPNVIVNFKNLLNIRFLNGIFYISIDESCKNKTIVTFINELFKNIRIYNVDNVISGLIGNLFNVFTSLKIFSNKNIQNLVKAELLLDRILKDIEIKDDYFSFETDEIENAVQSKKTGYYIIKECDLQYLKYDINLLSNFTNKISDTSTFNEETININLNYLLNNTSKGLDDLNKNVVRDNLFFSFFKKILFEIFLKTLSPQNILIVRIVGRMVNDVELSAEFEDFSKEIKNFLFQLIKNKIQKFLMLFILNIILEELSELILKNNIKKQEEQIRNYKLQIQSLLGLTSFF